MTKIFACTCRTTSCHAKAAQIGLQLAKAVQQLHAANILHLGIKPDNVWLDQAGSVFLSDFGKACHFPAMPMSQAATTMAGRCCYTYVLSTRAVCIIAHHHNFNENSQQMWLHQHDTCHWACCGQDQTFSCPFCATPTDLTLHLFVDSALFLAAAEHNMSNKSFDPLVAFQKPTAVYRSPEIKAGFEDINAPADFWSLAATIAHTFTGKAPEGLGSCDPGRRQLPEMHPALPVFLQSLLNRCFAQAPILRPSVLQVSKVCRWGVTYLPNLDLT